MPFSSIPKKRKVQPADVASADGQSGGGSFPNELTMPATPSSGYSPRSTKLVVTSSPRGPPEQGKFIVFKFGGSSMGSPTRIAAVVEQIIAGLRSSPERHIACVVSAMGGTTDDLLSAAEFASIGRVDAAQKLIDSVSDRAVTNAFASLAMLSPSSPPHHPTSCADGVPPLVLDSPAPGDDAVAPARESAASQKVTQKRKRPYRMPQEFVGKVKETLEPLRKIMDGMSLLRESTPQGLDYALSFGERLSALVLSYLLKARGVSASFVDARTWLRTDEHFGNARPKWEETQRNVHALWTTWAHVSVHTGFIGSTSDGRTTTLGRNGSDYSATLLGSALCAQRVVINTDVDGVMTADPRIVDQATPVDHLSYEEALELAVYGTRLFHPRTFFPLILTGVPMLIRNTQGGAHSGTLISKTGAPPSPVSQRRASFDHKDDVEGGEKARGASGHNPAGMPAQIDKTVKDSISPRPTCVTSLESCTMVEFALRHHQASASAKLGRIMTATLAEVDATVYMEAQAAHGHTIVFVIPSDESSLVLDTLTQALSAAIQSGDVAAPRIITPVTMLSVVLEDMRDNPSVSSRVTGTLAQLGIKVLAVTMGSRSFSCVINGEATRRAVRAVHDAFNLSEQQCSLCIVSGTQCQYGSSTTAMSLVNVISEQNPRLRKELDLNLNIVGACVSGRGGSLFEEAGVNPERAKALFAANDASGSRAPGADLSSMVARMKGLPNPILVDCSGEAAHKEIYEMCFSEGIDVVCANARSLCALPRGSSLLTRSARGAIMRYDTTVGGALPVLSTIRSCRRSGDRIVRIQAALSGSINAIASSIVGGEGLALSSAVKRAMESKFMEVDPRLDLLGIDLAHKIVLLAREVGFPLGLSDIKMTPFVPESVTGPCLDHAPTIQENEEFFQALERYDTTFAQMVANLGANSDDGKVLRYVGDITFDYDTGKASASVAPIAVGSEHGLFGLRGKEVFVALTTSLMPAALVLCGAGQGGKEGASGLLGDIIRVARRF
eukprot:g3066.t1